MQLMLIFLITSHALATEFAFCDPPARGNVCCQLVLLKSLIAPNATCRMFAEVLVLLQFTTLDVLAAILARLALYALRLVVLDRSEEPSLSAPDASSSAAASQLMLGLLICAKVRSTELACRDELAPTPATHFN